MCTFHNSELETRLYYLILDYQVNTVETLYQGKGDHIQVTASLTKGFETLNVNLL